MTLHLPICIPLPDISFFFLKFDSNILLLPQYTIVASPFMALYMCCSFLQSTFLKITCYILLTRQISAQKSTTYSWKPSTLFQADEGPPASFSAVPCIFFYFNTCLIIFFFFPYLVTLKERHSLFSFHMGGTSSISISINNWNNV